MYSPSRLVAVAATALIAVHAILYLICVLTGIRVGRLGFLSLRHVEIKSQPGVVVRIGTVGFRLHRPTISQPSWVTLVVSKTEVSVALDELQQRNRPSKAGRPETSYDTAPYGQKIANLKAKMKKLVGHMSHLPLHLVDISISNTVLVLRNVAKVELGTLNLRLSQRRAGATETYDTGSKIIDNSRGIELVAAFLKLFISVDGGERHEITDLTLVNLWAAYGGEFGVHDVGVSVKMSKVDLPLDSVLEVLPRLKQTRLELQSADDAEPKHAARDSSEEAAILRREMLILLMDLVRDVQLHLGFLKVAYETTAVAPGGKAARLTFRSKDIVLDLNRLAKDSPDFRMLFDGGLRHDAHQAIITAISSTIHLQSDAVEQQIVGVPMLTVASKFSTAAWLTRDRSIDLDPNAHLVQLDTVITSPAVDVYVTQLPVLFGFLRLRKMYTSSANSLDDDELKESRRNRLRRSIPKLNVSFGIHEPSVRIILPIAEPGASSAMIVGRQASIYLDVCGYFPNPSNYAVTATLRLAAGGLYFQSPTDQRHDIVYSDGAIIKFDMSTDPIKKVNVSFVSESSKVRITQQEVISCCRAISAALVAARFKPDKLSEPLSTPPRNQTPKALLPGWLNSVSLVCRQTTMEVCGKDKQVAEDARGIRFELGSIHLQLNRENTWLVLNRISDLRLYPIESDDSVNTKHHIAHLPHWQLEARLVEQHPAQLALTQIVAKMDEFHLGFSLFWLYTGLQAAQVVRSCFLPHNKKQEEADVTEQTPKSKDPRFVLSTCRVDLSCRLIRLQAFLPQEQHLMLDFDHLHIYKHAQEPVAKINFVRLYTRSPVKRGSWDRLLSIRDAHITREGATSKAGGQTHHVRSINIRTDGLRIRLPHKFVFYETLEALLNTIKATTQVVHRWKTNQNSYVIAQEPKKPKKLPRIRVRSRIVLVGAEDDPFEARLGLIYRTGMQEQKMREARDLAFENRLAELKLQKHRAHEDFSNELQAMREHHSRAWLSRIQHALQFRSDRMMELKQTFWGHDDILDSTIHPQQILSLPERPALFMLVMMGLDLTLDQPSFPLDKLPDFLHDRGKGIPREMQYSLLVPLSMSWKMEEARIQLRDYPLPLLHVPPLADTQRFRGAAWHLTTDLCIAEQAPEDDAIRRIDVCVVPADTGRKGSPSFSVEVQRTANSVKTFANINIDLNSALPMRVHWGNSMQPGVSDMMRIVDTLSKPQTDPSEKLGFWDKLRLIMHTAVKLRWPQDGAIHVTLKGTRDPYIITGEGAGVTKVFRGNVHWNIGVAPDSRKLMEVTCDEYMLAIADFGGRQAAVDRTATDEDLAALAREHGLHHYHLHRKEVHFQKILMKLTGDVRWTAGLAFERHCGEGCEKCQGKQNCRLWDFEPHWLVKLVIPKYAILPDGSVRDAFKGFRSHYVHMQISVASKKRENATTDPYNTIHLSPKGFAHFFAWIHTFGGSLSLPIRVGPLFPANDGPKKKFSHHLATIKYNLDLKPLYMSHMYKVDRNSGKTDIEMIGVKARIASFVMDLHQRSEDRIRRNPTLGTERKSSHMALYRGQVDLEGTDLRALSATYHSELDLASTAVKAVKDPMDPRQGARGEYAVANKGNFDVAPEDISWIDMDDFIELDTILPETVPRCKILHLAYSPRFVYDRDTTPRQDLRNHRVVADQRFGFEKTHYCSMAQTHNHEHTFDIQQGLWQAERDRLRKALSQDSLLSRDSSRAGSISGATQDTAEDDANCRAIRKRLDFVDSALNNMDRFIEQSVPDTLADKTFLDAWDDTKTTRENREADVLKFSNRFVIHDLQMKWNNTLRNLVMKYVQSVSQRRGFSYYMSQRAVRFLANLVEEQATKQRNGGTGSDTDGTDDSDETQSEASEEVDREVERLIKQLLDDKEEHFIVQDESQTFSRQHGDGRTGADDERDIHPSMELNDEYAYENSYILRLILPQIQLQSEKNPNSCVLVAAQSIGVKMLSVMDKEVDPEDVSALVQRRFQVAMSNAQFFHANRSSFQTPAGSLLQHNSYGAKTGTSWPAWLPKESVVDYKVQPRGFCRIVDRTTLSGVYCKHNQLRIKGNKTRIHKDHNKIGKQAEVELMDSISVFFPQMQMSANSQQYYAMLTIAMDLLMYSEPLQKERNERMEKILLAADFSDLSGAPEMVISLQHRIRQMEESKVQMRLLANRTGSWSRDDELKIEEELQVCQDELFFLMKSVATMHRKTDESNSEVVPAMSWHLAANEIIWHLIESTGKPFIDFGLSKASFQRTDNTDSSNFNTLEIEMMQGINLSPNPVFPELFAPYFGETKTVVDVRRSKMVRVYWYMLEAIGGIAVCDHFEVNLFPLKIQIEHEVGKKIFEYVFPDKAKGKEGDESGRAADSDDNDDRDDSGSDSDASSATSETISTRSIGSKRSDGQSLRRTASLRKSQSLGTLRNKSSFASLIGKKKDRNSVRSASSNAGSGTGSASGPYSARNDEDSRSVLTRMTSSSLSVDKSQVGRGNKEDKDDKENADDLTAMVTRANKNMSLVYVKVPSSVLSLSYKGSKQKNFVDITDFVFRLPTIEYRNKTWSYLDLAEHLKREVIRAVLAHTGSLIRDKMTHHKKQKRDAVLVKQLTSYRDFVVAEAGERGIPMRNALDTPASRAQASNSLGGHGSHSHTRSASGSAEQSPSSAQHHGLFHNAIGKHVQHLSHLARHKDGLTDDNDESRLKKTKMLLGKLVPSSK
ncbi:Protein SABRE [Savitreella phatthalungensis]